MIDIKEEDLEKYSSPAQLAKLYHKSLSDIYAWFDTNDYMERGTSSGKLTLAEKHRLQQWFRGEKFGALESYAYGYFLGDGSVCGAGKTNPYRAMRLQCCNQADMDDFRKFAKALGCVNLYVETKGFSVMLSGRRQIANLKEKGLLFESKCKNHPDVDKSLFDRFEFLPLLRGYYDTDGTQNKITGCLQFYSVCEKMLKAFSDKLKEIGVQNSVYKYPKPARGQQGWMLIVTRKGVARLLDLGLYSVLPEIGISRKRIVKFPVSTGLHGEPRGRFYRS